MSSTAVEALKRVFPTEQLALAGTDEYEKLNSSYLSLLESEIAPAAIFLPKTADDVSRFITTIKGFVLDGSAHFASKILPWFLGMSDMKTEVESHSSWRGPTAPPEVPGCANVQGGIKVDLRLLTGIEIKEGSVSIAAGERWGGGTSTTRSSNTD